MVQGKILAKRIGSFLASVFDNDHWKDRYIFWTTIMYHTDTQGLCISIIVWHTISSKMTFSFFPRFYSGKKKIIKGFSNFFFFLVFKNTDLSPGYNVALIINGSIYLFQNIYYYKKFDPKMHIAHHLHPIQQQQHLLLLQLCWADVLNVKGQ